MSRGRVEPFSSTLVCYPPAMRQSQARVPVDAGRLALGTWQGIYLREHRTRGHRREIAVHLIGE
jgi:thiamine phosphate synthase YjbQ (UPF0047 family)